MAITPLLRKNLTFLCKKSGLKLRPELARAMKDPGNILGKLFSRSDLTTDAEIKKNALSDRIQGSIEAHLQRFIGVTEATQTKMAELEAEAAAVRERAQKESASPAEVRRRYFMRLSPEHLIKKAAVERELAKVPKEDFLILLTLEMEKGRRVLGYLPGKQLLEAIYCPDKTEAKKTGKDASFHKPKKLRLSEKEKAAFFRSDHSACRMARVNARAWRHEQTLGFIDRAGDTLQRAEGNKESLADQMKFERSFSFLRKRILIEQGEDGFLDREAFHQAVTISNTMRTIYGTDQKGPPADLSEKMKIAQELAAQVADPIERAAAQIAVAEDMVILGSHENALSLVRDDALFSVMEVGSRIKRAMFLRDIINLAYLGRWHKKEGLFFLNRVEHEMSACWTDPVTAAQMPDHISRWRDEDWAIGLALMKKQIAEGEYQPVWQMAHKFIKSADKIGEISRRRRIFYCLAEVLVEIGKFNKAYELINQALSL